MSRPVFTSLLFVAVLVGAGSPLAAQESLPADSRWTDAAAPPTSYQTPPAITVVDGGARLVRQGQAQTAVVNMPLLEGDRIVTDSGRVAVTFPDGSTLHLDRNTSVDFLSLRLVRLLDGRVIFVAAGRGGERPAVDYQIDAVAASVQIQAVGEYRFSTYSNGSVPEVELDVISGVATLMNERGNVEVGAGQRSWAREGVGPEYPQSFNSARWDAFDRWSEAQRNAYAATVSNQYLPSDLYAYSGTFDRYGRWDDEPGYGYVWYPRVAVGWRPYYNGYWDYVGPYGWTWIGFDTWAWPTHHFGRWGFRAGLWFWIPARHWAPAWVSWAFAPGYLSWCPLDFYNRPVINIFVNSRYGSGYYDPWLAWTAVPRRSFGVGIAVPRYAVRGGQLPATERSAFAVARSAPDAPRAIARSAAGSYATGTAAPRALGMSPSQQAVARERASAPGALPTRQSGARERTSAIGAPTAVPRGTNSSPTMLGQASPGLRRQDDRSLASPGSRRAEPGASQSRPDALPRSYYGAAAPRSERSPYAGEGDNRSIARGRALPGGDRPSAAPGQVQPRGYDRPLSPGVTAPDRSGARRRSDSYAPSSPRSSVPGVDRPAARPRGESYAPSYSPRSVPRAPERQMPSARPRGDVYAPSYAPRAPERGMPSARPRGESYAPSYAPRSAPDYAAPRYSPPSAPSYSAPRNSPPPRYSSPPSPGRSMPSYSAPSGAPPRSGPPAAAAPRSSPPSGAPAQGSRRGGRGGR